MALSHRDTVSHILSHLLPDQATQLRRVSRVWLAAAKIAWPDGLLRYLRAIRHGRREIWRDVFEAEDETEQDYGHIVYGFRNAEICYHFEGQYLLLIDHDFQYTNYTNNIAGSMRVSPTGRNAGAPSGVLPGPYLSMKYKYEGQG